MMFVLLFEDNDARAAMRPKYMAEHLAFLNQNKNNIQAAGPLKDSTNGNPAGGIWIVEADNSAQVQCLIEQDPFWPTGLRKSVRVLEWTQVFTRTSK